MARPAHGCGFAGCLAVAAALLVACAGTTRAASIEKLLMPGPVVSGHAKLEHECSRCHDRADRDAQARLCRDCHEPVDRDVVERRGYHGRLPGIGTAQCSACHTEHKGRKADVVKLEVAAFPHARTDFPLQGAHATVPCASCHAPERKYREAPTRCVDCHESDEPHAKALGTDCGACHQAARWTAVQFDHAKTTFALTGKHEQATCDGCHFGNRYDGTPGACAACHAPEDVHAGARGPACADCHTTSAWTDRRYDHLRATGFGLSGAHARLECETCHRSGNLEDPLPRDCKGCHRSDDPHVTRFGDGCEKCHGSETWRPARFDHTRDGRYELRGAHAKLDCYACHTGVVARQKLGAECAGCHRASDVHGGRLGRDCAECHGLETWRGHLQFDHDFTDYPLVGLHVAVPCFGCHVSPAFDGTPQACNDCHADDDVHKGSLGTDCAACHSANGWNLWEFDHGKATKFALTGAHAKTACAQCHRQPAHVAKPTPQCAGCHVADDVHLGRYGQQCQRCHSTNTFRAARLQ